MSLVVCSNNSDDIGEFDRGALDQAPFRFRNHLVNPIELPSNCEVSVQSVKINKNGLIRVSPVDKFFIYFGKRITSSTDPDSEQTASFPIMGRILPPGSTEPIYVNMSRFTELLQDAVLLAIPHPDLDRTNTKVTQLYDGGATATNFSGFKFEFAYQNGVGNGLYDSSGAPSEIGYATKDDWKILNIQHNPGEAPAMDITLDSGNHDKMKIEAVSDGGSNSGNVCWLNKRPLSHMNGVFEVDVSELKESGTEKLNGGFAIGLVRGTASTLGQMKTFDALGGDLTNSRHFYDFVIYSEQISGSGDFFLRVGHSVYNTDDATRKAGKPFVLEEIVYYDDGDGSSFATNTPWKAGDLVQSGTNGYNLSRNFGKIDKFIFKLDNEQIKIEAQSVNGSGFTGGWSNAVKRITSFNAVSGHMKNKNIPKPVGTTCWNLFPKIMIRKGGRSLTVDKYDGREISLNGVELNADNPDGSWFVRMMGDESSGRLAMAFDSRDIYRLGANPTATPSYTQLSTTDATDPAGVLNDYRFILMLGSGEPFYRYTGSANLQSRLGFQGKGIVGNGSSSDSQTQDHSSPDAPDLVDYSSAFIRLDNFTQKSYNAGTGRPSKILYQVPRFDTSNREFGNALYYEPQERTYIKLHNSKPLKLNELHLSICDNLERLCDAGITGKTVVCLHFRQSSTPLFKLTQ
tara:strand:+ start:2473 stop:4527 length:2055 start_codon:yes stop_codon:yes gene_type:complete